MHLMTWEDEVLGNEGSTLLFPSVSVLLFFVIWVNITLAAEDEAVVTFKKSERELILSCWEAGVRRFLEYHQFRCPSI